MKVRKKKKQRKRKKKKECRNDKPLKKVHSCLENMRAALESVVFLVPLLDVIIHQGIRLAAL